MDPGLEALYATLELRPGASIDEVRRAYRRLALKAHPDLHRDRPDAHERFVAVAGAYRALMDVLRTPECARPRTCGACGRVATLYAGTDGRECCGACLLGRARRLLPHPVLIPVRFAGVFALLTAAACCLIRGARSDAPAWSLAALLLVTTAMGWLATVTIRTVHVYDRRLPVSCVRRSTARS